MGAEGLLGIYLWVRRAGIQSEEIPPFTLELWTEAAAEPGTKLVTGEEELYGSLEDILNLVFGNLCLKSPQIGFTPSNMKHGEMREKENWSH